MKALGKKEQSFHGVSFLLLGLNSWAECCGTMSPGQGLEQRSLGDSSSRGIKQELSIGQLVICGAIYLIVTVWLEGPCGHL